MLLVNLSHLIQPTFQIVDECWDTHFDLDSLKFHAFARNSWVFEEKNVLYLCFHVSRRGIARFLE